jgi:UPF0176 protein
VNHALEKGTYDQCHACRYPITEADKQSEHYIAGASCPRCHDKVSDEQRQRFLMREKQMQLARERGEVHMGEEARVRLLEKRSEKMKYPEAVGRTAMPSRNPSGHRRDFC